MADRLTEEVDLLCVEEGIPMVMVNPGGAESAYLDAERPLNPKVRSIELSQLSNLEESTDYQTDDPFAFIDRDLWSKQNSLGKRKQKLKLKNPEEIAKYIQQAGSYDDALLSVIAETDSSHFPESIIEQYVVDLLRKGAKVTVTDELGNTPLHLAAEQGFADIATHLLKYQSQGADPHKKNKKGEVPLEIAVLKGLISSRIKIVSAGSPAKSTRSMQETIDDYNAFAVLMCQEMQPSKVRALFKSNNEEPPRLNFHALLDSEHMQDTVNAVLNSLIERVPGSKRTYTVYYDLLESNKHGKNVSENPDGDTNRRKLGKSAFEKIAWSGNKEAISHLVVGLMMNYKWKNFARNILIVKFVFWAITMIAISAALIIAAGEPDPRLYNETVDIFRGVCEGLAILLVTFSTLDEIYHIYLWRLSYFKDYNIFLYNYLNLFTALFMIILIPLRVLNINEQWIFAAFVYVSYSVKALRYITSIKILGKYIQILFLIIRRDLVPFISVLIVVLFIFTGGFYFALREEVVMAAGNFSSQCDLSSVESALNLTAAQVQDAVNTSTIPTFRTSLDINPDETSTYYRIFFTGIRIAVEGQNFLTYFGPDGFGWLGVITYLIFLFMLEVIMLNLLIAQMSDTFSNVQGDAQRSLAIDRARTIISIQKSGFSFCSSWCDLYKKEQRLTNPHDLVEKLDQTSITNIHRITLRTQRAVYQYANTLDDLRDSLVEQNQIAHERLAAIENMLTKLESLIEGSINRDK